VIVGRSSGGHRLLPARPAARRAKRDEQLAAQREQAIEAAPEEMPPKPKPPKRNFYG